MTNKEYCDMIAAEFKLDRIMVYRMFLVSGSKDGFEDEIYKMVGGTH